MIDKNLFVTGLFAIAVLSVISTFYFKCTKTDNITSREKLARNVYIGSIIIFLDLLWCVPVSRPIAPEFLLPMLYPLVIILTFIGSKFLDYHFARAVGGLIILSASFFLANVWAFTITEESPLAAFFTLLTFAFGTIGLFLAGKPYLLRDWFRKVAVAPKLKIATNVYFLLYAAVCVSLAVTLL